MKPGTTYRPEASTDSRPSYHPVDDGDVRVQPLAREDRKDASAADDEVGRLVSACDREAALKGVHEGGA